MNSFSNEHGSTLDLVFTNNKELNVNIFNSYHSLVPIDRYHPALHINLDLNIHNTHNCSSLYFDYKNGNYNAFNEYINNTDWSIVYASNEVNTSLNHFYNIIKQGIQLFIPTKTPVNSSYPF